MLKFTEFNKNTKQIDKSRIFESTDDVDKTVVDDDQLDKDEQSKKERKKFKKGLDRIEMDVKKQTDDVGKNNPDDQIDLASNENFVKMIGEVALFENINPQAVVKYINENNSNLPFYMINLQNELHIIRNTDTKKLDVKLLIESLIIHYNKMNSIKENISNMVVKGNKSFAIIKQLPPQLHKMLIRDIPGLLK